MAYLVWDLDAYRMDFRRKTERFYDEAIRRELGVGNYRGNSVSSMCFRWTLPNRSEC